MADRAAPRLSVAIVSWNTADLLEACLRSIFAPPLDVTVEVIVVDNASADDSAARVRACFPQATLIANPENVGFARANNQALRVATGDYVALLNPDTEVAPGALDTLVRFLDAHPRAGAVGPLLLNPDGSLQVSCYPAPTPLRELWHLLHLDRLRPYGFYGMERWSQKEARPVDVLKGACLVVRRPALAQVGELDEDYFMYSEEVDLCQRLRRAGWELHWVPQARVMHHGGQSTKQVAPSMFLRLYQGKVLYYRKHHGERTVLFYKLVLLLVTLPRLLAAPRRRHRTMAQNYWRLLKALPGF